MDFAFNDLQREIQEGARRLIAETASLDQVVALAESERGWDPAAYKQLAELGWTGLHVPEEHGGAGLSYVELIVVLEQMGGALHPSPFFASVCLAANALIEGAAGAALSERNAELLAGIASGAQTATVAQTEPGGGYGLREVRLAARRDGEDYLLTGSKSYVLDGLTADAVITVARTGPAADEIVLLNVPSDAAGLTRTAAHVIDTTRRAATLSYEDVRVPASALVGDAATLRTTNQLASVALAAESLGAAQHCFDAALGYTKDRFQFGRPIASFQAVKHICADLLMAVEAARSASYYAGWVAAEQRDELPEIAPLAKAQACESFWDVARANIQLHGGIGFTYEHEAHYYYRRATSSRALLGGTNFNRELLLEGLGVAPVSA